MIKLCVLFLTTIVIVVSGVFLSDGVKNFRFKKIDDGSDEFEFEWDNIHFEIR